MTLMKNVLCNLIYNTDEFCGLCFKAVGDNALRVQDEVWLVEHQAMEEIQRVLVYVLGSEISDCLSVQDPICEQCIRSALSSYKFMKMCKDNSMSLCTVIDSLDDCVGNTTEGIEEYKTVFFSINTNNTSSKQLYDDRTSIDIKSAIKRLKTISKTRFEKRKTKQHKYYSDDEWQSDSEYHTISSYGKVDRTEMRDFCTVLISKNGTKTFQCNICHIKFKRFYNIEHHIDSVHGAGNPDSRLFKELNIKEDPEERKNRICTQVVVDNVEKYMCKACSAVFKTYGSVQCHYNRFHTDAGKESRLLICSQCGKTFRDKYALKQHELSHTRGDSKVSCPKCNKVYKSVNYLKLHLCNPNNERIVLPKIYGCDMCGKKYGRRNTLKYHIEYMHHQEAFVCIWCKKKFPSQAALTGHIVTHTKERNSKCDVCGGLFVTKAALKVHLRIHTGEKPYACEAPGCDLCFISASRRSEHYKRRHTEPSIECDMCHKIFRTRQALLKHMKRHYNPRSSLYIPKI